MPSESPYSEGHYKTAFQKGQCEMQTLGIRISKQKINGGTLTCRRVTVREKLLRFLLGTPIKLTVLVPGETVSEVTISEGGKDDGHNSWTL